MGTFSIALVALAVTCISIAITASALNTIAISQTEPQRYNLNHGSATKFGGSAPHFGIVHVAMPKGKKTFPAELVPVP